VGKQRVVGNYEQVWDRDLENKGLLFTFAQKGVGNHVLPYEHNTISHNVCHTL
jgi:hypothetical protein